MVIDHLTRGLTLTRPWPYAFTNGPGEYRKRIENRSWAVPMFLRGIPIALHAGKGWGDLDYYKLSEIMTPHVVPYKLSHPHSVIFAVCSIRTCVHPDDQRVKPEQKRWAFGPSCWIIDNFVELVEPVPCKGAQGLWTFDKRKFELEELKRVYALSVEAVTV